MIILNSLVLIIFNYYLLIYIFRKINLITIAKEYISSFKILIQEKESIKASSLDRLSLAGIRFFTSLILILIPYFCFYLILIFKLNTTYIYALLIPSVSYLALILKKSHWIITLT